MNASNARVETNANKTKNHVFACILALGLALIPTAVKAEGSAPALLGVQEILVMQPKIGDGAASDTCGLLGSDMADTLLKKLKEDNTPAFSPLEAPVSQKDSARIELVPEVVTLDRQGLDCISWVSMSAQSRESLTVPPIRLRRNVYVTYWRGGLIVSSNQTNHRRAVNDALTKLAQQFGKQYRSDQPPPLPNFNN